MEPIDRIVAKYLLEIEAVKLSPEAPFTWASGWKSPIYCDNRKILSYPGIRSSICDYLADKVEECYGDADIIAGVATGAIAFGAIVANKLDKPFIYIRSSVKDHGMGNQIEGVLPKGAKVVIIEDLVSTGISSLSAAKAVQGAGAIVLGMTAIFSYNFDKSRRAFENANIELHTLSNYDTLIDEAIKCKYIHENDEDLLREWRFSPDTWNVSEK